ncbi:MAG: hypothetical protein H5T59_00445 [Anaerolineae bacterium]|nr:hypothetical protein [Anaerolineae bacterium]
MREKGGISVSAVLLAIGLVTALGSLYVYLVGYEARLHAQVMAAQQEARSLRSEIADLRRQLAEAESYMRVKPQLASQGMRDLRPSDCRYFLLVPPEAEQQRAAPASAVGRAGR